MSSEKITSDENETAASSDVARPQFSAEDIRNQTSSSSSPFSSPSSSSSSSSSSSPSSSSSSSFPSSSSSSSSPFQLLGSITLTCSEQESDYDSNGLHSTYRESRVKRHLETTPGEVWKVLSTLVQKMREENLPSLASLMLCAFKGFEFMWNLLVPLGMCKSTKELQKTITDFHIGQISEFQTKVSARYTQARQCAVFLPSCVEHVKHESNLLWDKLQNAKNYSTSVEKALVELTAFAVKKYAMDGRLYLASTCLRFWYYSHCLIDEYGRSSSAIALDAILRVFVSLFCVELEEHTDTAIFTEAVAGRSTCVLS